MGAVYFARPRHDYASYADYWRLIKLAGYPLIYADEIDPASDNVYIYSTPDSEWRNAWPGARARIIYWALEWYDDVQYADVTDVELWSADAWYAKVKNMRYVPLGGHPSLVADIAPTTPIWDVVWLATLSPHRNLAWRLLQEAKLSVAPNAWGDPQRDSIIRQSRVMLHVHQYAHIPAVSPMRFVLASAYRLPLFAETLGDPGIFTPTYIYQSSIAYLAQLVAMWLRDERQTARLRDMADALHYLLCERQTFRAIVDAAL